jgi:enoyl-CoA hydratase/carnithine racemase
MSTEKKYCDYTVDERGVALMAVNNPPMNTLSQGVLADIKDAIKRANADPAVRAVVFTGEGKAFIAGAAINEFVPKNTKKDGASYLENGQEMTNLIENSDKPYIAAINGYCLGGGMETALACHIRLADETAQIGLPEIKLGIIPGYGGTQRSARLIGKGRALELILSGNFISGKQAELYGIVNRAVSQGQVVEEAKKLATAIAARSRCAVKNALRAVSEGPSMEFMKAMTFERELFGELCETADKKEGIAAFLEKREAKFTDR